MPGTLTYFLSDLHLGARYIAEPREHEMRVVRWLDSIKHNAKRIFLLGDILDYWYEYRYVVPRGHVRFLGKLAELADSGVEITWMTGNHDIWLFDYLSSELGITVVDGPVKLTLDGKTFLLDHGDGVGRQKRSFAFMRQLFRNRFCQMLYAGIHPRWTVPLANGWSKENRVKRSAADIERCIAHGLKALTDFSEEYSKCNPEVDYFVYGHLHTLIDDTLSTGKRMLVLGEWIGMCTYAVFDGNELTLKSAL